MSTKRTFALYFLLMNSYLAMLHTISKVFHPYSNEDIAQYMLALCGGYFCSALKRSLIMDR